MAVSFACEQYVFSLPDIEQYIGQTLPVDVITEDLLVTPQPPAPSEERRPPPSRRPPRRRHRSEKAAS